MTGLTSDSDDVVSHGVLDRYAALGRVGLRRSGRVGSVISQTGIRRNSDAARPDRPRPTRLRVSVARSANRSAAGAVSFRRTDRTADRRPPRAAVGRARRFAALRRSAPTLRAWIRRGPAYAAARTRICSPVRAGIHRRAPNAAGSEAAYTPGLTSAASPSRPRRGTAYPLWIRPLWFGDALRLRSRVAAGGTCVGGSAGSVAAAGPVVRRISGCGRRRGADRRRSPRGTA